ncbi:MULTISPECIES: zinc finger domain-containing protein [Mycobacterium]|uniref:zinc finger domain-containing protein n=1 Tax=Mycobacterium TaxID=1763 RepID=UPI0013CF7EA2|nr:MULTISPECIES: hypothetical protein [Mycobacterium]MCV7232789.1 hypothetical protein [Mycobacterium branderi]
MSRPLFDQLGDRNSDIVQAALTRKCEQCGALPGDDCTNLPINGHPLHGRIVHYGRSTA